MTGPRSPKIVTEGGVPSEKIGVGESMSGSPQELRDLIESARLALFRLEESLEDESDRASFLVARAIVEKIGGRAIHRLGKAPVVMPRFPPTCRFALLTGEPVPRKSRVRNVLRRIGDRIENRIERAQTEGSRSDSVYVKRMIEELAGIEFALGELTPVPNNCGDVPAATATETPTSEEDLIANLNAFWGSESEPNP